MEINKYKCDYCELSSLDNEFLCAECQHISCILRKETNPAYKNMMNKNDLLKAQLAEANEDAERLADELKIVLLKTGVVWEEAGEDSPALIIHRARIQQDGEG